MRELKRDDKLGFGKYHDKTVDQVMDYDPRYLLWAIGKDIFTVSMDVYNDIRYSERDMYESDEEYYIGCPEQN